MLFDIRTNNSSIKELVNMRKTSPGSKAIVFSQFVSMIDLIRWRLHSDPCLANMGLGVRALHGSMDVKARDASLKEFREDGNVRVLLMSLKAGGVALNLTVANHIYLMDPWVCTILLLVHSFLYSIRNTYFCDPFFLTAVESCGRDAGNRSYPSSRAISSYQGCSVHCREHGRGTYPSTPGEEATRV